MCNVCERPEAFRVAWSAGFYDVRSTFVLKSLDRILRRGVQTWYDHEFLEGFLAGRRERLSR
jgi:hypothetical protein